MWSEIVAYLEKKVNKDDLDLWLKEIHFKSLEKNVLELSVPNKFFQEWLEDNCLSHIKDFYLEKEEKELKSILESVPHSENNDVLKNEKGAHIAYAFESFFSDCYTKGTYNLSDQKVKETLKNLYFHKFKEKNIGSDEFTLRTKQVYELLKEDVEDETVIGVVMLRLIISINAMSGGAVGPYGYLNYLKNNMFNDGHNLSDGLIVETKYGEKRIVPYSEL